MSPIPAQMSLTPELVALCERPERKPDPDPRFTYLTEADLDNLARQLLGEADEDIWIFGIGSLIWNPDFPLEEHRRGTIHGWHRSFCIELRSWRGTPEQPGLMLGLEPGGSCTGVVFRMARDQRDAHMRKLVAREISVAEDLGMVRWTRVHTADGPVRALVFWAGPTGEGIELKLPLERVAWVMARACGYAGSSAAYVYNTVVSLERHGIHDRNMWRLQHLLAQEIRQIHGLDPVVA